MPTYAEEVHPSQLRRAMSNYNALGVPVQGYSRLSPAVAIIIIQLPDGVAVPDWQAAPPPVQPPPWRRFAFSARTAVVLLCIVVVVVGLGAALSGAFAPAPPVAGEPAPEFAPARWWERLPGLGGAPRGEPVVVRTGLRWPWDAATDNLRAAADSAQATVTTVSAAVVLVLALLIVLALLRKRR